MFTFIRFFLPELWDCVLFSGSNTKVKGKWNSKKMQPGSANTNIVKEVFSSQFFLLSSPGVTFDTIGRWRRGGFQILLHPCLWSKAAPSTWTGPVGSSWTLIYEGVSSGLQLQSAALCVPSPLATAKLCLPIPCYSWNHRSSAWAAQTGLGSRVDAWVVCLCDLHTSACNLCPWRWQHRHPLCPYKLLPAVISSSWRTVRGYSFGKLWTKTSHLVRWSLLLHLNVTEGPHV